MTIYRVGPRGAQGAGLIIGEGMPPTDQEQLASYGLGSTWLNSATGLGYGPLAKVDIGGDVSFGTDVSLDLSVFVGEGSGQTEDQVLSLILAAKAFQGNWEAGTYRSGSIVVNNDAVWLAIQETDTEASTDSGHWILIGGAGAGGGGGGGSNVSVQDTPPESPSEGDLWVDTSEDPVGGASGQLVGKATYTWANVAPGYQTLDFADATVEVALAPDDGITLADAAPPQITAAGRYLAYGAGQFSSLASGARFFELYDNGSSGLDIAGYGPDGSNSQFAAAIPAIAVVADPTDLAVDVQHDGTDPAGFTLTVIIVGTADVIPTSPGAGASEQLFAQASMGVSGAFYGAQGLVALIDSTWGSNGSFTATVQKFGAGGGVTGCSIRVPTLPDGATLQLQYAELDVSNGAGTQAASASTSAAVDLVSGDNYEIVWDGGLSPVVGTDLVLDGQSVTSTAGGAFGATLTVNLAYTPPA